jgi:transcriptional regulator with XRE-family HTH domain
MKKETTKAAAKYRDIGNRLKRIREKLGHTLDTMNKDAGISRSYLSEFERGLKLPNTRYIKFLFEKHNVNIHYIFNGKGDMFNPSENEKLLYYNFGKFEEEIKELLYYITNVPHALYDVLGHFTEYKLNNEAYLKKIAARKKSEKKRA